MIRHLKLQQHTINMEEKTCPGARSTLSTQAGNGLHYTVVRPRINCLTFYWYSTILPKIVCLQSICSMQCFKGHTLRFGICRHATISWGNPYFFCENLYQSVSFVDALMYRDILHAIRIAMQFAKNRDIA